MMIEQINSDFSPKNKSEFIIGRAEKYIAGGNLKEAIISIGSDINDDSTLDDAQKKVIVGLAMDYQSKPNLSRDDVDTFIEYVKKILKTWMNLRGWLKVLRIILFGNEFTKLLLFYLSLCRSLPATFYYSQLLKIL